MAYVIKRYANRKLYDIQQSRYVTLQDLEEMICAGREISVVNASSGDNLTSITLTQIVLENERNGRAALPTAFLHQLIKHGEAWQDFVQAALRSSLEGITASQGETDRILHEWARVVGLRTEAGPTVPGQQTESPPPSAENLHSQMETLKAKLRELEQKLREEGG